MMDVIGTSLDGTAWRSGRIWLRLLIAMSSLFMSTVPFSLDISRRLPGIWKLASNSLPNEPSIRSKLRNLLPQDQRDNNADDIYLKLSQDGTFKQYNEGYREGRWLSGRWKLVVTGSNIENDDRRSTIRIILALNRQYFGPQYDVVLDGWMKECDDKGSDESERGLCLAGSVQKGKFLYPRRHPSFFDPPILADSEILGTFVLEQTLSFQLLLDDQQEEDALTENHGRIKVSDFYGRRFIMTVEPLEQSIEMKQNERLDPSNHPVDIRAMPVQFFANNTFTALGVNKIIRGRFQVVSNDQDYFNVGSSQPHQQLSMAVSVFGAGRSAPGSVFSEGLGLTHDDERTYLGEIQQHWEPRKGDDAKGKDNRQLLVLGTVFYGTDLGEDARPEPVARFVLVEDESSTRGLHSSRNDGRNTTENIYTVCREGDGNISFSNGGVFQ